MSFPLTMSGWDRTYQPPRAIRSQVPVNTTAWDLMHYELPPAAQQWATATLESLLAAIDSQAAAALGCTDCEDTGFYGVSDPADPDMLIGLLRRVGDGKFQTLQGSGDWDDLDPKSVPLEILTLDLAGDLAAAITGGACGLVRRYCMPKAFLPPCAVVSAAPLADALMSLVGPEPPERTESSDNDWVTYAVVDDLDPGAVLDLVRVRPAGDSFDLERWDENSSWTPDSVLLAESGLPTVRLTNDQLSDVQEQLNPNTILSTSPAALVADAPLTVSPNPKAEKLRRYWSTGRGGAKIRWTAPGSGDFMRCYRHLRKYMGIRAKGYCANLHKRNTGVWPGDRRNTGHLRGRRGSASPEEFLLASVRSGQWGRDKERNTGMPLEMELLQDGVYYEGEDQNAGILRTLTAGGFPVAPPDDWYKDPKLDGPTPMEITDKGQVFGHIATWDVTHIGMPKATHAPHSPSGYKYFLTGQLKTESGQAVNVGQLTLAGGHADINGNVQAAVQHYDDTNSAVADVTCGEDQYGIWVAGGLRPSVTDEQVRIFRASPPSGDWRPVNGHLEMVACCSVNVPGFMNVRPTARVASGAVVALVAAGTAELNRLRVEALTSTAVLARLETLESTIKQLGTPAATELVNTEPVLAAPDAEPLAAEPIIDTTPAEPLAAEPPVAVEPIVEPPTAAPGEPMQPTISPEEAARAEHIARVRDEIRQTRKDALRGRVSLSPPAEPTTAAAGTIKGTDSFPITDVASLKKAIQAFGRAGDKAAAKKHIISKAYELKRPDLIPSNWRGKS